MSNTDSTRPKILCREDSRIFASILSSVYAMLRKQDGAAGGICLSPMRYLRTNNDNGAGQMVYVVAYDARHSGVQKLSPQRHRSSPLHRQPKISFWTNSRSVVSLCVGEVSECTGDVAR